MSPQIDTVFDAYEQGRLSRRQVAYALLALAMPAVVDAQTNAGAVPARTVNHVQICVTDPEKSKAFYGTLFGARKIDDYAGNVVQTLALPGNAGWISLREDAKRAGQMDHYAIGVDAFDAIKYGAALKKAMPGAAVTGDDAKSRSVWVTDPDGVRVQIISKDRAG